ncbi:MAG: hypothetical protein Q8O03_02075 [Nanoarchaeota archaeon]|nr:hypothetical protein [Nanoarchaeota archaeon]
MRIIQGIKNRLEFRYALLYDYYLRLFWRKARASIFKRKGKCKKCGTCCRGYWGNPCPNLDLKTNLCKDFELAKLMGCALFPTSPLDQKLIGIEKTCGHYWDKTK